MDDGMPHDPIQGKGHETFKVRNSSIFKICSDFGGVDRQSSTGLIYYYYYYYF